ncbi:MAG: hypothetical protein HQK79_21030 [Desulfobacterales bacterium]|nr:hypothetical protein [Desulfobacterales bacterium]
MINYSLLGFLSWLVSSVLFLFHLIDNVTYGFKGWKGLSLASLIKLANINSDSFCNIPQLLLPAFDIPLFLMLFFLGILAFILNGIFRIE